MTEGSRLELADAIAQQDLEPRTTRPGRTKQGGGTAVHEGATGCDHHPFLTIVIDAIDQKPSLLMIPSTRDARSGPLGGHRTSRSSSSWAICTALASDVERGLTRRAKSVANSA